MSILRLDHLVLTVNDLDETVGFYTKVLGMKEVTFGSGRRALTFGNQKINLHQKGSEFEPKALKPLPGSPDQSLITDSDPGKSIDRLKALGVRVEKGPVERTGALGSMTSVYLRDPDGNLIEVSKYNSG